MLHSVVTNQVYELSRLTAKLVRIYQGDRFTLLAAGSWSCFPSHLTFNMPMRVSTFSFRFLVRLTQMNQVCQY